MDVSQVEIPQYILTASGHELKVFRELDIERYLKVNAENQKYFAKFDFDQPTWKSAEEVSELMEKLNDRRRNKTGEYYLLWIGDQIVGLYSINRIYWEDMSAEVGYWTSENAAGKGLTFETFQYIIKICKDSLKLERLFAHTATTNLKSQRILENSGFKRTKLIEKREKVRGVFVDGFRYDLVFKEL